MDSPPSADDENSTSSGQLPPSDITSPMPDSMVTLMVEREKRGQCADCGMRLYEFMNGEVGEPRTIQEAVFEGRCLLCNPLPGWLRAVGKKLVRVDFDPHGSATPQRSPQKKLSSTGADMENSSNRKKRRRTDTDTPPKKEEYDDDEEEQVCVSPSPRQIKKRKSLQNKGTSRAQKLSLKERKRASSSTRKGPKWFQTAMKLCLENQDDPSVSVNLFKLIRQKAQKQEISSYIVHNTDALEIILDSMKEHHDNMYIQSEACNALSRLAWLNKSSAQMISSRGTIPLVIDIMKNTTWTFQKRKFVTEAALEALHCLSESTSSCVEIVSHDGLDHIFEAMKLYGRDDKKNVKTGEKLVVYSLSLLQNLSFYENKDDEPSLHDISMRIMMPTKDYINILLSCIQFHSKKETIQEYGCGTIQNLTLRKENKQCRKAFFEAGVIPVIINAMVKNYNQIAILKPALQALLNFFENKDKNEDDENFYKSCQKEVVKRDAIKMTLRLMKRHDDTGDIQEACLKLLYHLIIGLDQNSQKITTYGGFRIILDAMKKYPSTSSIQEDACYLFSHGVYPAHDKGSSFYDEMGSAVIEALRNHPEDVDVQAEACDLMLYYKSKPFMQSILKEEQTEALLKHAAAEFSKACGETVDELMDIIRMGKH